MSALPTSSDAPPLAKALAVLLAGALTGCGARTGLDVDAPPGADHGSGADAGSTCTALVLASDLADPDYVRVDATGVYWIANAAFPAPPGAILRCDKAGCCGSPTVLASLDAQAAQLASDDTRFWWADPDGNIQTCTKQACVPQPFTKGPAGTPLVLDPDNVYFDTPNALSSCPKTGCAAPTPILPTQPDQGPGLVAVDATRVYFADAALSPPFAIRACALPACAGGPTTIVDGLSDYPLTLALDDTQIYFSLSGDVSVSNGAVFACSKSGCGSAPTTLATGLNFPNNLAVSGARLYWTTGSNTGQDVADGQVVACATSGCGGSPEVLAGSQPNPNSLAVDDGCVYWSNAGLGFDVADGSVQRVPK